MTIFMFHNLNRSNANFTAAAHAPAEGVGGAKANLTPREDK